MRVGLFRSEGGWVQVDYGTLRRARRNDGCRAVAARISIMLDLECPLIADV
jgi:hypothetical protein